MKMSSTSVQVHLQANQTHEVLHGLLLKQRHKTTRKGLIFMSYFMWPSTGKQFNKLLSLAKIIWFYPLLSKSELDDLSLCEYFASSNWNPSSFYIVMSHFPFSILIYIFFGITFKTQDCFLRYSNLAFNLYFFRISFWKGSFLFSKT